MGEKSNKPVFLGFTSRGIIQIIIISVAIILVFFLFLNTGMSYEATSYSGIAATAEFSECLTNNDAVLYGANWCSHCNSQKSMFGEHIEKIAFIDCDESRNLCELAEIEAYPTWVINGKKHLGVKSLNTLGALTGCELG